MLKYEEAKAILESMLEPLTDDPKPDWKESLGDAAHLLFEAMVESKLEGGESPTSTFDTPKDALAAVVALSMESLRDDTTEGDE